MTHTPGPWKVKYQSHSYGTYRIQPFADAERSKMLSSISVREEREANGRLIEAAPDLLEVVEAIIKCNAEADHGGLCDEDWGHHESEPSQSKELAELIAKAEALISSARVPS